MLRSLLVWPGCYYRGMGGGTLWAPVPYPPGLYWVIDFGLTTNPLGICTSVDARTKDVLYWPPSQNKTKQNCTQVGVYRYQLLCVCERIFSELIYLKATCIANKIPSL